MRVTGYSRQRPNLAELDEWFPAEAFGGFLGAADFVVLTLPATPTTHHIVNRDSLRQMRPGAWLLNLSRGALIDETALIEGLRQGQLAGAVLDVFEREPLEPDHPFWEIPNVIVTSHQSGAVIPEEVVDLFEQNLERYRRGEPLINEIDVGRGY
jgi:glyoxylate/hydroxypyruvate reductase A